MLVGRSGDGSLPCGSPALGTDPHSAVVVPSWLVGPRDGYAAKQFISELHAMRKPGREISSPGEKKKHQDDHERGTIGREAEDLLISKSSDVA